MPVPPDLETGPVEDETGPLEREIGVSRVPDGDGAADAAANATYELSPSLAPSRVPTMPSAVAFRRAAEAPLDDPASRKLERRIIFLVGAVQFVNVLDFMIVMPMGPDFADALDISTSHIGLVGGIYTVAASIAGVIGSLFLDRFDRKKALTVAMLGLAVGTASGGFATGLFTLLGARVLAGMFGGPATSIALAIITDAVPAARRGKALGAVMAAFSLASILGVPAGLELSGRFGFRAPFFTLAAVGMVITLLATRLLPPMTEHLKRPKTGGFLPTFDRLTLLSLANTGLVMMGVFAIVPNLSAYVQHNMGYPRELLGMLYLVGGGASFVALQIAGILVDRFGAVPLVVVGTIFHLLALDFLFLDPWDTAPIFLIFTLYMMSGSVRMVPIQTLGTQVPEADQRARFMSAQSAVQHLSSAFGAFMGSLLLVALPDGTLVGMELLAWGAVFVAALVPILVFFLEKGIKQRARVADPAL